MRRFFFNISLHLLYLLLDVACIFVSVFLAYGLYHVLDLGKTVFYDFSLLVNYGLILSGIVCGTMFVLGAYRRDSGILNVLEVKSVIMGVVFSFGLVNILLFSLKVQPARYLVFMTFMLMIFLLPLVRSILYNYLVNKVPSGMVKRVLIYGSGELGSRLFREISNSPRLGIRVWGMIDDNPDKKAREIMPCGFQTDHVCRILGGHDQIPLLIHTHGIDEIYIAISRIDNQNLKDIYEACKKYPVKVAVVPNLYDIFTHRIDLDYVGNIPLIRELKTQQAGTLYLSKRIMDLTLCCVLGLVLAPVMGLIALAIKYNSKGPVFFKHERIGRKGVPFQMYKFRSMHENAPKYAVKPHDSHDPHVTRVGRFLRKTSLDELPQIINVIKGDMSFVGPRPEMPFIVEEYNEIHRERLKVLPGITGLWQLSGDRKKAIHENMDYDLYYIYNRSIFLDVTILFQTLIFAFRGV